MGETLAMLRVVEAIDRVWPVTLRGMRTSYISDPYRISNFFSIGQRLSPGVSYPEPCYPASTRPYVLRGLAGRLESGGRIEPDRRGA